MSSEHLSVAQETWESSNLTRWCMHEQLFPIYLSLEVIMNHSIHFSTEREREYESAKGTR